MIIDLTGNARLKIQPSRKSAFPSRWYRHGRIIIKDCAIRVSCTWRFIAKSFETGELALQAAVWILPHLGRSL